MLNGGKYSQKSMEYLKNKENREKTVRFAESLGVNISQSIENILDDLSKLVLK